MRFATMKYAPDRIYLETDHDWYKVRILQSQPVSGRRETCTYIVAAASVSDALSVAQAEARYLLEDLGFGEFKVTSISVVKISIIVPCDMIDGASCTPPYEERHTDDKRGRTNMTTARSRKVDPVIWDSALGRKIRALVVEYSEESLSTPSSFGAPLEGLTDRTIPDDVRAALTAARDGKTP